MYREPPGRLPAITPQLAVRVAIVAGIALALFAVVFFRLWYLQVLTGDRYLAVANDNRVRDVKVAAPRGKIVDRQGQVLVDNRSGLAVMLSPEQLPRRQAVKTRLYERLGRVLQEDPDQIRRDVREQLRAQPFSTATVKQDVDLDTVSYIEENRRRFPGVEVEPVFLRSYPRHSIGAHLFGYVGEITEEQLDTPRYRGATQGDRVGQAGIEKQYDRFLRGRNGARRVQVDAMGAPKGRLRSREPRQGNQLRLTMDLDVQRTGQDALGRSARGAFAVMDVKNGEVLALGSSPSFDPSLFAKAVKQTDYDRLTSEVNGKPLFNRAIQGGYVTGSTFKLVTAVAALEGGQIEPDTPVYDPGYWFFGREWTNAGRAANGTVAMRKALEVSSDVYFYKLGAALDSAGDGQGLQRWSGRLGVGRRTGIDLPNEDPGLVPSRKWLNGLYKQGAFERPWSAGDNVNLSVGQGDLRATPLQMAVAYAAVANGGYVLRPRLGLRLEDPGDGRVVQELRAAHRRRVRIDSAHRQAILDGLFQAANGPRGTSTDVFKNFPIKIAGKTGTAEKGEGRPDQSWYVALAPFPNPRYVVAVTDEQGGFGAETAAPAACKILGTLLDVRKADACAPGASRTR